MNHLNKQINALGKAIAKPMLPAATAEHAKGYITMEGGWLVQMYTKRHQVVEGLEMTGINIEQLEQLLKRQAELNLSDVYFVFTDSKNGLVYGQTLRALNEVQEFYGIKFPYYKAAIGGGRIIMWPIHKMDTLGRISDEDLEELRKLQAQNKSDSAQTSLF